MQPLSSQSPAVGISVEAESQTPVTSEDTTPYARAPAGRERPLGWWSMAWWMFPASAARISHVSLIRSSPASRRFARVAIIGFSWCAAVAAAAHAGWMLVADVPIALTRVPARPVGKGWYVLTHAPPRMIGGEYRTDPTDLWWNPVAGVVAAGAAFVIAGLAPWLFIAVLRGLTERALRPEDRGQKRLTAAIHYALAWAWWLGPATLVLALLPLSYVGRVHREGYYPSAYVIYVTAAVVAAPALLMGWLTLIRAAATVPPASRGRIVTLYVAGAPLLAAGVLLGGAFAAIQLTTTLNVALHLQWQ